MLGKLVVGFLLLALWFLNLYSHKTGKRIGVLLTKPFLMPLLLTLYLMMTTDVNYLVVMALCFGFIGDVFLLWVEKKVCLICGMLSFLTGHILYISLFLGSTHFLSVVPAWFYLCTIPYLIFGYMVFRRLADSVGAMRIPVLIYMLVLLTMSFTSLSRAFVLSGTAFWLPFIGSLCFLTSDTLLSFLTFRGDVRDGNVWVMLTYVLAQILIVTGLL